MSSPCSTINVGTPDDPPPTISEEGQAFICSYAASKHLHLESADISNTYFQGEQLTRPMLFKQPPGGLPGVPEGARILARVPIYGTKDAGRKFWKRLRSCFIEQGFKENRVMKALYSYTNADGKLIALCATHVDDLLWAATPEGEGVIQRLISTFKCGEPEEMNFRYCGKEVNQDGDFNIKVTCKDTTNKLHTIQVKPGRKPNMPLNDEEKTQLKSVAGSLAWISRQCRPELDYGTSKVQQFATTGTVADIRFANKVVRYARETSDRGLTFMTDTVDWDNIVSIVVTDASHACEAEVGTTPSGKEKSEDFRSQGGRIQLISNKQDLGSEHLRCHLIGHSSSVIRRVCRSTIQAEAYQLSPGVEEGDRIRVAIADLFNKVGQKTWEADAAAYMQQVWFTDCKSVYDSLRRSVAAKTTDKRLGIEIASLRQYLWRQRGECVGNPTLLDELPDNPTDTVRWIDTDVMIADPLTKTMEPIKLMNVLDSNMWDVMQPIEAIQKKRAKQAARRKILDTWERIDYKSTHFKDIDSTGPSWRTVTRRVTKDLYTGEVIDDDFRVRHREDSYLFRELPLNRTRGDIRTIFYYLPSSDSIDSDMESE